MRPSYSGDPYDDAGTFRDLHSSYGEFLRRQDHAERFEARDSFPPVERNRPSSEMIRAYNGPQRHHFPDEQIGSGVKSDFWRTSGHPSQVANQQSWRNATEPVVGREWPAERLEFSQTSVRQSFPRNGIVPRDQVRPAAEHGNQSTVTKKKRPRPPKRKQKRGNGPERVQNASTNNRMSDKEMEEAAQLQIKLMAEMEAKALAKEKNINETTTNSDNNSKVVAVAKSEWNDSSEVLSARGSDKEIGSMETKHERSSRPELAPQLNYPEGNSMNDQLKGDTDDNEKKAPSSPKRKLRILDSKFEDVHLYHRIPKSHEPKTMKSLQAKYKPPTISTKPKALRARERAQIVSKPTPLMSVPIYPRKALNDFPGMSVSREITSAPRNGPAPTAMSLVSSVDRQKQINDPSYYPKHPHQSMVTGLQQPANGPSVIQSATQSGDAAIDPSAFVEDLSDLDEDWSEVVSMLKPRASRPVMASAPRAIQPVHGDKQRSLLATPATPTPLQMHYAHSDKPRSLLEAPARANDYPTMLPPPRQIQYAHSDKPRSLLEHPFMACEYSTMVPSSRQMQLTTSDNPRTLLGPPLRDVDYHVRRQPESYPPQRSLTFSETSYPNRERPLFNGYQSSSSRIAPAEAYLNGSSSREAFGSLLPTPRGMMRR